MEKDKDIPQKFQLGFDDWDKQHVEILAIIDDLFTVIVNKKEIEDKLIDEIMFRLFSYGQTHFVFEEKKMEKYQYPNYEFKQHLREHLKFTGSLNNIKIALDKKDHQELKDIITYLRTWFRKHIQKTDKLLANYIREEIADDKKK